MEKTLFRCLVAQKLERVRQGRKEQKKQVGLNLSKQRGWRESVYRKTFI